MIVIDSSAIIAILNWESEAPDFLKQIESTDRVYVSAVTVLESKIVIYAQHKGPGLKDLETLLVDGNFEIIPFDYKLASLAIDAFRKYGKGVHPKARLNICDCASYALAKQLDAPLLFKGNDFAETDVKRC